MTVGFATANIDGVVTYYGAVPYYRRTLRGAGIRRVYFKVSGIKAGSIDVDADVAKTIVQHRSYTIELSRAT